MLFIHHKIAVIFTILLLFALDSQAYPGFTSDCSAGNPLGGSHLKANSKGTLSSYGIQLKIGSTVISEGGITTIPSERSLPISLVSTSGRSFRGFQIRVSNPGIKDTSAYLAVARDTAVQVDKYCTVIGVGGLSHNSKRDKQTVEGIFTPPPNQVDGFKFEVVIVVSNGPSVWYRSEYSVNFKVSTPSASPTALAPSTKPANNPTSAPSTTKPTKKPSTFPFTTNSPSLAPKPTAAPNTGKLTIMPSTQFPTTEKSPTLALKPTTAPSTTKLTIMPPTQFPTTSKSPTLAPKPTAAPSTTKPTIKPPTQFPTTTKSPTLAPLFYTFTPVSSDDDPEMDDNEEESDDDGEINDDSEMDDNEEESDDNVENNDNEKDSDDNDDNNDDEKDSEDDGEKHDNSEMNINEKESEDDGKNNDDGDDAKHQKKNGNFHWSIGVPWA